MYRKRNWIAYIVFGLAAIGFVFSLLRNLALLIPIVIFGLVFFFYKFPPSRFRSTGPGRRKVGPKPRGRNARKARFRVIPGNKKDGDDEPPRYH